MNHTLPRFLFIGLLAGVTSTAMAQTDLSYLFTSRPKYYFSAGINLRTGGPSVKFSHLGTLPRSPFDPSTGTTTYDDGYVGFDAKRSDETSTSTSTVKYNADGTRYQVIDPTSGLVYSDELAYQSGLTRVWSIDNASQVHDGYVDYHYTTAHETGERDGSVGGTGSGPGKSSGGFDIQLARDIGLVGKRSSWGIAFSIGMNDINSKASEKVTADAYLYTGRYKLNDTIPASEVSTAGSPYYTAPSPSTVSTGGGGIEDTARISASSLPFDTTSKGVAVDPSTDTGAYTGISSYSPTADYSEVRIYPNAATVTGTWKIKGAYYLMRLGPTFRFYVSKHISVSGSAGVAGAYAGSDFDIDETLTSPTIAGLTNQPTFQGTSHKREFKVGGFGEANAEYWVTFRTGFYAGVVYEALGHYKHEYPGTDAVADVNIGSGLSFRIGLITRF